MNFSHASRYWALMTVSLCERPYKRVLIPQVQNFLLREFEDLENQFSSQETPLQIQLLEWINTRKNGDRTTHAEMSMRCRVSHAILSACKRLTRQFGSTGNLRYKDLLPIVLLEDSRTLQRPIRDSLVLEILQKYNPQRSTLEPWVLLKVKQHSEIKRFLLEHNILHSSKWGVLIHRDSLKLLEPDYEHEKPILQVFQDVYRRDRQRHRSSQSSRCKEPTLEQLNEMLALLKSHQSLIKSPQQLLQKLDKLSSVLRVRRIEFERNYPTISLDVRLDSTDSDREITLLEQIPNNHNRHDLNYIDIGIETIKQNEFEIDILKELYEQRIIGLDEAIQNILARKSPLVKQELFLYYVDGLTQGEIAKRLGIRQDKVSRDLKLKYFYSQIRELMLTYLTNYWLQEVRKCGLVDDPEHPDYQQLLIENLTLFINQIFQEAAAETMNSRKIERNSLFAQRVCQILREQTEL